VAGQHQQSKADEEQGREGLFILTALDGWIVGHPPEVFELGHDAVDEGVRNEGFVASALVDLTRRRLSVDDVVDTETKRAGELPAELLAEIKGAQIIPTPRCQNYLRARKRRLATCPKAQAFSIYDRCKARYARY
jgi:hypothetical protein